jgi:LmbE family N-acetylglucosaminyl deacetylase
LNSKLIILLATIILILGFTAYAYSFESEITKYPQGPNITASDRVLIVAPHPDDETIATGGVIRYCIENKIPVSVVVVTNGGSSDLGVTRYYESLNGTDKLDLPPENITFLEYTQGVDALFNENWDKNRPLDVFGNHTQHIFAYQRNAPYSGESLETNMENIIGNFKPTIIIYPHPNDANPDHFGTSAFVDYAINSMNYKSNMYTYMVHVSSIWPFPRSYFPQTYLLPPSFLSNQPGWMVFPLKESDEQIKYKAVNTYKSQINPDPTYLRSFVRKNELFMTHSNITVTKNNIPQDFIHNSQLPETIIKDPKEDTLVKPPLDIFYSIFSNLKMMDITDVGFEIDKNNTWISLKTDGGISKNATYQFHIRSFGDEGVKRIDVKVQNGRAEYLKISKNSAHSLEPLKVKVTENSILIGLPSSLFKDKKFMLNVDDMKGGAYLDRTGYYTVDVI